MTPRRLARLLGWLGSAVLAAVLIVTVWVVRHRNSERLLEQAASVVPGAILSARNFHWTQMKGGRKQWELTASGASFSDDKKSLNLQNARLSMVAEDGRSLTLHAPRAKLTLRDSHVSRADLSGGLEAHYGDLVVTAARAAYTPDTDELEAPGPVTIEGQDFKVTGLGMTAHPHADLFNLHQQVSTELTPKSGSAEPRKLL